MWYEKLLERNLIPDFLIRSAIRRLLQKRLSEENSGSPEDQHQKQTALIEELRQSPIAIYTDTANEQHYEVPAEFFNRVLGRHRKYSCGLWPEGVTSLSQSEEAMLSLYCERAGLKDGQEILDLGCGWGSLSIYLAVRFPGSRITGVSNSAVQRKFIEEEIRTRSISNLTIITANVVDFDTSIRFDRVISIEMFEHMRNYEKLMTKISSWLKPDGKLFVHIFAHQTYAYPFEAEDSQSWMSKYFFSGGMMPSKELLLHFQENLKIENQWTVNGTHYQKTCEAWLKKMDSQKKEIMPLFRKTYGADQALRWWVYWRIFFMSCAELFGYHNGNEWGVEHYLFKNCPSTQNATV